MKNLCICLAIFLLSSCGYTSIDNEVVGQIKKITNKTPLICPDHTTIDISLGIFQNGVGSMSKEDMELYIPKEIDIKEIHNAHKNSKLVKIKYNVRRFAICILDRVVNSFEVIE